MKNKNIIMFRENINEIDRKIIELLCQRKKIVKEIGEFKVKNCLPVRDLAREREHLAQLTELSWQFELDPEFIKRLFCLIMEDSIIFQQKIAEDLN